MINKNKLRFNTITQKIKNITVTDNIVAYVTIAPVMILLAIFTLYPIIYLVWRSLFSGSLIQSKLDFVGFQNYIELFSSEDFIQVLQNTIIYTIMLVGITLILAVFMAVWLNSKITPKLNQAVQAFIFTPHIISLVSASIVFLWLMDTDVGFINMMLESFGLTPYTFLDRPETAMVSLVFVMVWKSLGYYTLLILAALQTIPSNIYEAAAIDDAPKLKIFLKITLPMISPTILFTTVVATINSFKVFDTVSVMTQGGPINSTNTLVYFIYEQAFRFSKMGIASAAGVILLIFVILMTYLQFGVGKTRVHYQ